MATGTLTGQTVANTYKSLLKVTGTTAGGETLGADTVIAIEDGDGNASSLSLSQQRATITLGSGAADDFIVDGTTLVVEGDTGNVGIGVTPDADARLHVYSATAGVDGLFVEKTSDDANYAMRVIHATGSSSRIVADFQNISGSALKIDGAGNTTVSQGNLVIGTAGKGITFSSTNTPAQSAGSGTSNTLDDYEEGTWTPVLKSGATTITRSGGNESATYTVIGNKVTVQWSIENVTTAGSFENAVTTITGLPFTAVAARYNFGTLFATTGGMSFSAIPHATRMSISTTTVLIVSQSATELTAPEIDAVGAGTYGGFQLTYFK